MLSCITSYMTLQTHSLSHTHHMYTTYIHTPPKQAGGHLTLRFVRINQGKGEIRAPNNSSIRSDRDGARSPGPVSIEIRGGSALFEPSAEGGTFVGVYFIGGDGTIAEVEEAINQSFGGASIRTFGGHVSVFPYPK